MHLQTLELQPPWRVAVRRYLNLGCGARYHPSWQNADLRPAHPSILPTNVAAGPLPFADACLEAVYHSHLLEHLPRQRALGFLQECRRVLQPGGILRVVVPDLEQVARLYLQALEDACDGHPSGQGRYEWMILEMLDQLVREKPGGAMLDHLSSRPHDQFALSRVGAEATALVRRLDMRKRLFEEMCDFPHDGTGNPSPPALRELLAGKNVARRGERGRGEGGLGESAHPPHPSPLPPPSARPARDSISVAGGEGTTLANAHVAEHEKRPTPSRWWRRLRTRLHAWVFGSWRERLVRRLLGKEYAFLQLGRFRRAGEVHHWMYDRHSLRELLQAAGFRDIRLVGPMESAIPDWPLFHLDVLADGTVAKPDSLYMEARK